MALVTTHCQGAAQGATRAVEDPGGGFAFAAAASIMSFGTSVSYWWSGGRSFQGWFVVTKV